MSYTSTYALFGTKVNRIREHRNGHGSGPAIWDYISRKVLGKKFSFCGDAESFWPSYKSPILDDNERAVLLSTYDLAYVETDKLSIFSEACKKVHSLIISETEWMWSHFSDIGDDAIELYKNHDYRCKGLAIGCTSVSDPWEQEISGLNVWGVYSKVESVNRVLRKSGEKIK